MKLVFITDSMHSGGAERVISVLANYFADKYPIEIICLSGKKSFYSLKDNITLTCLEHLYGKNLLNKFIWLFKNIDSESLIIAFMVNVYIFTLVALFFRKVKIIVSERNDPTAHMLPIRVARKLLIWRAQELVVQTQDIANYFPHLMKKKIDIIYNPISDDYVWKSGLTAEKDKVIVNIGRLSPQKNHKMLINAFSVVSKKYPEYQLHIYGEGEIQAETESYIALKGLQGKVILKGKCNTLGNVLPKAEIFALSSDYEGMSNALIEAMYVGVPVVTTAVSGTKELIDNGKNGYIVPVGDEKAFTEALMTLVENKNIRNQFAQKEIQIITKVQPLCIMNKWQEIINKVWKQ